MQKTLREYIEATYRSWGIPQVGDSLDFIINEEFCIESHVVEQAKDGIIVELDEFAVDLLESIENRVPADSTMSPLSKANQDRCDEEELDELSPKARSEYAKASQQDFARHKAAAKTRRHVHGVDDEEAEEHERIAQRREHGLELATQGPMEAKYQGREVPLGKPMAGDQRKYKVYVKNPKTGNIKKVNFGDPNMTIKRDDPKRRKSFRARHGCGTSRASDRTKAAYWSCRMWSTKPVSKILKGK